MGDMVPRKPHKTKKRPSEKLQYIGLAVLAVITLALVGFVLLRPDPVTPPGAVPPAPVFTSTPSETVAPPAPPVGASLEDMKAALASDRNLTISILGDSTGNSTGEWVDLWGRHLAEKATVTIHLWDQSIENWRPNPVTYPGPARTIEIWNGSMPGATADYPASRMQIMQPAKPDLMILSFGHNGAAQAIAPHLQTTVDASTALWGSKVPVAAVLQNKAGEPRTARTDENQQALRGWATESGTPIIDVRAAFDSVPDLQSVLVADGTGVHPNDAGSRIWADAVAATLG